MCHILYEDGQYLGGITILHAKDGLCVLVIIHCKSEKKGTHIKLFEFFKTHYINLISNTGLAISCDADKGLGPVIISCFPNAT